MKLNKKALIFSLAAIAVLGVGALGAKAFWGDPENRGELAKKIAEKFNLNQGEVEGVMNQFREEKQAQMQERQTERLSELVSEGKLTEEQKKAIIAKREEMRSNRPENIQNLSEEERKALMEKHREEMDKWMEDNGIDHETFMLGMGPGGKGGFGKGMRGNN